MDQGETFKINVIRKKIIYMLQFGHSPSDISKKEINTKLIFNTYTDSEDK